jgi:hypothetical protein
VLAGSFWSGLLRYFRLRQGFLQAFDARIGDFLAPNESDLL